MKLGPRRESGALGCAMAAAVASGVYAGLQPGRGVRGAAMVTLEPDRRRVPRL